MKERLAADVTRRRLLDAIAVLAAILFGALLAKFLRLRKAAARAPDAEPAREQLARGGR
jgi:hypothetical protein